MTKALLTNNHMNSLIKGMPVVACGMLIVPNGEIQQQLINVKMNGWENDVNVLFDQEKKLEIRMRQH